MNLAQHYPPVLVVPDEAKANPEDVETLRKAGVLILRCANPSEVVMRPATPRAAYGLVEQASIKMVQYLFNKENDGLRHTTEGLREWFARILIAIEKKPGGAA